MSLTLTGATMTGPGPMSGSPAKKCSEDHCDGCEGGNGNGNGNGNDNDNVNVACPRWLLGVLSGLVGFIFSGC